ncbi:hypothetical protein M7I_3623 [Glarea lozoyensis 74030]|uniref:Uncharacterized protein n=1 Tax=Glarea lozoyensis (strain ATCC 74030 / MF5533) TaxID=1104152 RepID=H0ELZ7_GLAL7|nr:hypothetical protein M7I_3623 [Glarea lozoyensis 74030]
MSGRYENYQVKNFKQIVGQLTKAIDVANKISFANLPWRY